MARNKYDPLEAAKVTPEKRAADDAAAGPSRPVNPLDSNPPFVTPTAAIQPTQPQPAPEPPSAQAASSPARSVFEVVSSKLVSLGGGQVHRFKPGDLLDPVDYGGEARLKKLGLDLRKVEVG